jgi:hypothetical protein
MAGLPTFDVAANQILDVVAQRFEGTKNCRMDLWAKSFDASVPVCDFCDVVQGSSHLSEA